MLIVAKKRENTGLKQPMASCVREQTIVQIAVLSKNVAQRQMDAAQTGAIHGRTLIAARQQENTG